MNPLSAAGAAHAHASNEPSQIPGRPSFSPSWPWQTAELGETGDRFGHFDEVVAQICPSQELNKYKFRQTYHPHFEAYRREPREGPPCTPL